MATSIVRRVVLGATTALAAAPAMAAPRRDWRALAEDLRAEMRWAWGEYRRLAWGKDEIKPVSGGASSFPLKDRHLGLSLIEALDTLWLMGLDAEFEEGVAWVKANFDAAVDGGVSVFETSIRLVGGLLSAHLASGDAVLLAKARDLAPAAAPRLRYAHGHPLRPGEPEDGARPRTPRPARRGRLPTSPSGERSAG